jgi:hypothetical protein
MFSPARLAFKLPPIFRISNWRGYFVAADLLWNEGDKAKGGLTRLFYWVFGEIFLGQEPATAKALNAEDAKEERNGREGRTQWTRRQLWGRWAGVPLSLLG